MDLNVFSSPLHNLSIHNMLQMREAHQRPIRVAVVGAGATW